MTYDTLEYNGVEKDFAAWGFGIASIRGRMATGGNDTWQATIVNSTIADEADTPTFAFEGKVIVRVNRTGPGGAGTYTGGTVKFVGKRVGQPLKADAAGQGVTYQFHGPWYDLLNTDYQQRFKGDGQTFPVPEVVLFTSVAVTSGWIQISVGDQIQGILQWLLDQYDAQGMDPPFQYKGRALHTGAIDLNVDVLTPGTSGGDYSLGVAGEGYKFYYLLQSGMSIESSLFSLFLPTFIEKPMKCAQALQKCLGMSPRVNIWFDYTTVDGSGDPLPTIRFDAVDSMDSVTLPLFTGAKHDGTVSHKGISITPRDDLLVRAVVINYRITRNVDGSDVIDYVVDKWTVSGSNYNIPDLVGNPFYPNAASGSHASDPNCGLRVLTELIDLKGMQTQSMAGSMDVEILACRGGTHDTRRTWWASRRGGELAKLEDSRVRFPDKATKPIPNATLYYAGAGLDSTGASVSAGQEFTTADYSFYTYRLVQGTFHAWMNQGGTDIKTVKCRCDAPMEFKEFDCLSSGATQDLKDADTTGNNTGHIVKADKFVNLELTNAAPDSGTSGYATFSTLSGSTEGEVYLTGAGGIAEYLYEHLNARQWEGDYVTVAANFMDSGAAQYLTLGKRLNLSGGATVWETMAAQIVEIGEDYGTHETSVKVGVSRTLGAGGLSQLLNMMRFRRSWYKTEVLTDNSTAGDGNVEMAKSNGQSNTEDGLIQNGKRQFIDYSTAPTGTTPGVVRGAINNDPQKVTSLLAAAPFTAVTGYTEPQVRTMEPRLLTVCDASGNSVSMLVMATAPFTT